MKAAVIFDLDGTLADTGGDLVAAANACFRAMGEGDVLDLRRDAVTAMQGGGRAMLRLGFARLGRGAEAAVEAEVEAGVERYYPMLLEAYAGDIARHTTLYPGAVEAVEALRSAGHGVGICTNKPEALAEQLLTELGIRPLFGAMVGADTLPVRKPDPAPLREAVARLDMGLGMDRSFLIGDSSTDRNTARAAGCGSVLVTFGPLGAAVADLEPEAMVDHFDELLGVVEGLLP